MGATDDWLASLGKVQGARTATVLSVDDRKPDDLADQSRIGQQLGLPPIVVASDPAAFKAQAEQKRNADFLANAPITAKWLQDRENGGLAKDDIENLSWFEKNIVRSSGALTRAAGRGVVRTGAMVPAIEAEITGSFVGDMGKTVDQIYADEMAKFGNTQNPIIQADARRKAQMRFDALDGMTAQNKTDAIASGADALQRARAALDRSASIPKSEGGQRFQDEVLDKAENSVMGVLRAFASDPVGGAAFIAETAAETLPLLLASTGVTLATRNPAAGISVMAGGSFLLENSSGAMEFLAEKGVDLSTPEAALAVLENPELMQEATQRGLSRGLVIALFDAVSGGVAGQTLMRSAGGEVVVQGIAQMALGAGGEAAAQAVAGQDVSWKDIVVEGLAEMATAPIEVGGVAGRGLIRRASEAANAGKTADVLAQVDEMAAASKLKARSPDKFAEAVSQSTEGAFIYVPAEGLNAYFQAKDTGFNPEDWGIDPLDFEEQMAAGGQVAVPIGIYASKVSAGTDDAAWFRENSVMSDDEMSISEAARFNEEVRSDLEAAMAEAEVARASEMDAVASDVQVYDGLYGQLRAAGRAVDVATNEAKLMTSFFRTMASRYGDDALALAQRFGLTIRGPEAPEVRRRGNLDIALNTLRRGTKAARGSTLLDFVQAEGGIRDVGGDLEAMGAPKGVISQTRGQFIEQGQQASLAAPVAAAGKGIDDMARAAVQAGYFPDYSGQDADMEADLSAVLTDAIREEIAGRPTFAPGEGRDASLDALAEELGRRGIDVSALSNDDIAAALAVPVDGDTYGQDGRLVTDTPEFKAWFGDSKVVGPDGEPLVVYKGMPLVDWRDGAEVESVDSPNGPWAGFFTSSQETASRFAGVYSFTGSAGVVPVYLSINAPFEVDADGAPARDFQFDNLTEGNRNKAITEAIASGQYDGVVIRNTADEGDVFVPLAPTQIKSVFNRGTFGSRPSAFDGSADAFFSEHGGDGLNADASFIRNLAESRTFKEFGLGGFDAPSHRIVGARVLRVLQDEKVREAVVKLIPVDVVDILAAQELAPEALLNDMPMLENLFAIDGDKPVAALADVASGIVQAVAGVSAKDVSAAADTGRASDNDGRALDATSDNLGLLGGQIAGMATESGPAIGATVSGEVSSAGAASVVSQGDASRPGEYAIAYNPRTGLSTIETFDPADPRILYQDAARGQITFPAGGIESGQTIINLFETANLSTLIHEGGHYFLEAFTALASDPAAPQAMRDDLAAIDKYLGGTGKRTREQHEVFARSFEAYLLEGKSPSLELADVFSRAKAWLLRIYQSVRGLNVKLSPEIREVFDRMIATDAEIIAARDAQGMKPLFTSEAAAGMSPEAFTTYQRMARRSTEQAQANLMEKTMAVIRRRQEAWWKAEKVAVTKEVEPFINSQRPYRLVEMLANKRWLGDATRDVPDMQMDRQELVDMFGPGVLAELSRERLGGNRAIYANGGASLFEVADMFGFANPQEMVAILQNAGNRKDAIAAEVDRVMTERHGDPLNDGSIEEEALAAIHSAQQAKTVAAEVRHLAKRAGLPVRNLTSQVFRARAKLMIGRMTVAQATRPDAFLGAERQAAKRAEDAFARVARGGGQEALVAATRYKEQQLLNHYLYLESRDLTKAVASGRERMRNYSKANVRKKLEGGYIEQIDALLDQYDFRVRSAGQIRKAESLTEFVQRMVAEGREGDLSIDPRLIERAAKKHYSRLSVDELRGLFDTIENIDHLGRFKQRLIDAKKKRDLAASVQVLTDAIEKNFGADKLGKESTARSTFNLLWTMDTMLVEYDGMKEIGPVYEEIKEPIDAGASLEQAMNIKLAGAMDELFKVYSQAELDAMVKPKVIDGANGRPWAKVEILAVALNMGNADNKARLFELGAAEENRLTQDQADALTATMDRRDWEFVQAMWDYIDSYYPQLAEVHLRRTGTKLKKVDAVPVETPHGTFRGGYYPIKYDGKFPGPAAKDEAIGWDKFLASGLAKAEVKSGMTQERQQGSGGRTLKLDLTVPFSHLRDTVRVIALSEAVDNAYRILNDKRTVAAFFNAGRRNDLDVFNLWLKDLAQGPVRHTDAINSFARIVKNNFTLSRLAFNLKTAALQVTGTAQSAAVIGKRNMLQGMMDYSKRPRELAAEVIAKSPLMAGRRTSMNKDIYDFMNDVELTGPLAGRWSKFKTGVSKWGFAPMTFLQFYSVDVPTWLGAYNSGLKQFGDEGKAAAYADRMIARSQDSGLMADRSAIGRGTLSKGVQQADFVRVFTTLGGYMLTKMNRGYITAKRGASDVRGAATTTDAIIAATSAATNLMLLYVAEGAMMALMYSVAFGGDDDEPDDYMKFVATETVKSVFGGAPFVRDAATAFQGYGSGGVLGSVLEIPANIYVQATQGENDKALRRSIADMVGTVTGMPTTATMRLIEEAVDTKTPSMVEAVFGQNPVGR